MNPASSSKGGSSRTKPAASGLRLYVARATPNSARAEQNLKNALNELDGGGLGINIEIVDVFTHPQRALTDGVIVTPTLIWLRSNGRVIMMGELTDAPKLKLLLQNVRDEQTPMPGITG